MAAVNTTTEISHTEAADTRKTWSSFLDNMRFMAQTKADEEAVVFVSTDKEREVVTWNELYRKSVMFANALVDTGVKQGEVVAICIRPCPEWLYMAFGTMFMGGLAVNMVFTYKDGSDVISFMERLGNCSFVAFDPGHLDENWTIFKPLLDVIHVDGNVRSKMMPFLRYVVAHHPDRNVEGLKQLKDWYTEYHPGVPLKNIGPEDTAFLFQTSGSTGIPKIIAQPQKIFPPLKLMFRDMKTKRFFSNRPFGWLGGFPFTVYFGITRVAVCGFSPPPSDTVNFIADVIKKENCDTAHLLPPMLRELTIRQEQSNDVGTLVRSVLTGGQPLTSSMARCIGTVCERMFNLYGSTEITFVSYHAQGDADTYPDGLCGKPMPGIEVKIVDDNGTPLPSNELGLIHVRTPFVMNEIYGDPEKTRQVLREDGWFETGDIGRINEDGQLFADGRKSNEIIRGGMNIAAESLEAVMRRCPDVDQVIIVPVPHPVLYQLICACVILNKGSKATEEDIRKYCEDVHADKQRVFSYLPDHYLIVDHFPETSTGKISRPLLAEMAEERFSDKNTWRKTRYIRISGYEHQRKNQRQRVSSYIPKDLKKYSITERKHLLYV